MQRVRDRKLFELLLDARAPPQPSGVMDAEAPAAPLEFDRDGVARDPRLGPGEQALLA